MKTPIERLYCVAYVEALERGREEIKKAMHLLNDAGVASGNEHMQYSLCERIDWLIKVRDYLNRKETELSSLRLQLADRHKIAVHYEELYKQTRDELAAVNKAAENMAGEADFETKALRSQLERTPRVEQCVDCQGFVSDWVEAQESPAGRICRPCEWNRSLRSQLEQARERIRVLEEKESSGRNALNLQEQPQNWTLPQPREGWMSEHPTKGIPVEVVTREDYNWLYWRAFEYLSRLSPKPAPPQGVFVHVRVSNARKAYGRYELLITPEDGSGEAWVQAAYVTLD